MGEANLCLDDVHAGHFLGDGVLHLQPGVGFDEDERAFAPGVRGVQEKLEGPQARIALMAGELNGGVDDAGSKVIIERRCRRDLDHLLVPPLHAALALAEMGHVASRIAENLHLDVASAGQELLDIDIRDAERRLGFGLAALPCGLDVRSILDHPRTTTTASRDGLDDHGATVQRVEERLRFL